VLSHSEAADRWQGRTGWVHEAVLAEEKSLAGATVYASGPPAMVEAIRHDFPKAGLALDELHFDSFDYAPDSAARRARG
jgi:CDP-4-dehydro-6-deoxyglucose reductase